MRMVSLTRIGFIIPAISAALLALAFSGWPLLAWIALIPIFVWLKQQDRLIDMALGGLAWGAVLHGITCFWLFSLYPLTWMGLSLVQSAAVAGGAWLLLVTMGSFLGALLFTGMGYLLKRGWWAVLIPMFWVLLFRLYEANPFWIPWPLLAYSQHDVPLLRQLAGVTGTAESITAILVAYSLAWAYCNRRWQALSLLLPLGMILVPGPTPMALPRPIAVYQGNLDIGQIRSADAAVLASQIGYLNPLTQTAFQPGTLLVLPEEGIVPGWVDEAHPTSNPAMAQLQHLAKRQKISILTGLSSQTPNGRYNTLAAISGNTVQYYHKRHLVPFGEAVPVLPAASVSALLESLGAPYQFLFKAGDANQVLSQPLRMGGLVCFDLIYADLAPQDVQLLVNSSNLGWFHNNKQMAEHFLAIGQLRAAENKTPLVIAANTGISAVIDANGRVLARTSVGQRAHLAPPY